MKPEHFISEGNVYFSVAWSPVSPTELTMRNPKEISEPVDDRPLETWAIYRRTRLFTWKFVRFFSDTAFGFLPEDITDVLIRLSEMDNNRRYRAIPLGKPSGLETRVKTRISFAGIYKEIIVVPT